jgi:hypothetical protein
MAWVFAALLALMPLTAVAQEAVDAPGGRLRVLDKLTSQITDLDLSRGQSQTVGRLTVGLLDCRYPANNPASDSWMHLMITDSSVADPVFSGWMLASSPALSALDNPRYDVWVLGCALPDGAIPAIADDATTEDEG